jgi:hypothetical protein
MEVCVCIIQLIRNCFIVLVLYEDFSLISLNIIMSTTLLQLSSAHYLYKEYNTRYKTLLKLWPVFLWKVYTIPRRYRMTLYILYIYHTKGNLGQKGLNRKWDSTRWGVVRQCKVYVCEILIRISHSSTTLLVCNLLLAHVHRNHMNPMSKAQVYPSPPQPPLTIILNIELRAYPVCMRIVNYIKWDMPSSIKLRSPSCIELT